MSREGKLETSQGNFGRGLAALRASEHRKGRYNGGSLPESSRHLVEALPSICLCECRQELSVGEVWSGN